MYQRVVAVVAGALFALLALVAIIVTDLHDREYPQAIDVHSRVGLNFETSSLSDAEAFDQLAELDAELGLGLVKVAPDLTGDGELDRKVFVSFADNVQATQFSWFGGGMAKLVGKDRLANSYADGSYLLTGDVPQLDKFVAALSAKGVVVRAQVASVSESLNFVMNEASFLSAVLAAFAMIVALALFWLSMRARSRALRVLGGCPVWRIHAQDLGGFAAALAVSAAVVLAASTVYVGLAYGWLYVGTFASVLFVLQLAVTGAALLAVLVMSATAWPTVTMLAMRQPAVRSLRTAAVIVQTLTFLLVALSAGPAWTTYRQAAATAADTAMWRQLSDQVGIEFGLSEQAMIAVEPSFGKAVQDAESRGAAALSYTFAEQTRPPGLVNYSAVALVNQRWLDLVTKGAAQPALEPVAQPEALENTKGLAPTLKLLSRDGRPGEEVLAGMRFLRPVQGYRLPVARGGGGGQLAFLHDVLVAVLPSAHSVINDSNLTSMASTRNLVFSGVGATQDLLQRSGLGIDSLRERGITGQLRVVYAAEDGILLAQFTAYVTWLLNLALVALLVAFAVAAAISALITALLHAKRDFPLRLSGRPWAYVLWGRVGREVLVGVGLAGLALLFQRSEGMVAVLAVAAVGLLIVPLCHLLAARWCFAGVGRRRI